MNNSIAKKEGFADWNEMLKYYANTVSYENASHCYGILKDFTEKIKLEDIVKALTKTCEYHEKNASWDKGDNGYYLAKKVLKQIENI